MKFPGYLGQQIQTMGNNVTVKGTLNTNREGIQTIRFVSIESGSKTVYNTKPQRTMQPKEEKLITSTGKVSDFKINRRGEVDGLILNNNTIINIPREAIKQLSSISQKGADIAYTGYEKSLKEGEVQLQKYTLVRPITITVNGVEYAL